MWFSYPPGPGRKLGLGLVPPWLEAWPVTTRGSPRDDPRDDPRDCTDRPPEQRKRKSRWVNASRVPERPVHSLGVKDSPAPAPLGVAGGKLFACSHGYPECLLERVPPGPAQYPRRVIGPADGRQGRQPRAESRPVLTGSSLCHPQTPG